MREKVMRGCQSCLHRVPSLLCRLIDSPYSDGLYNIRVGRVATGKGKPTGDVVKDEPKGLVLAVDLFY